MIEAQNVLKQHHQKADQNQAEYQLLVDTGSDARDNVGKDPCCGPVGVAVDVAVDVDVSVGVPVVVGVNVGPVGVDVGVAVGPVGVAVDVLVNVGVSVGVSVEVGVSVGPVGVAVGVNVGPVCVGVGVGSVNVPNVLRRILLIRTSSILPCQALALPGPSPT